MVSAYHKLENAKMALNHISKSEDFEVVSRDEALGHASIAFKVRDTCSLRSLRTADEVLRETGFEESKDSEVGATLRYEWDKKALSEHMS